MEPGCCCGQSNICLSRTSCDGRIEGSGFTEKGMREDMEAIRISTDKCPKPGGWYSQAYRAGNLIFTAGVTANDPVTQELVGPGDIVKQTEQVLKNMDILLREAGSDLKHVIKTLVFVSDINDFSAFNETYKRFFPENPPARSTMQIGRFNHGMVIEIEAVVPEG